MLYTPLHRLLGEQPGPLTDRMIDDAVAQGIEEGEEIDWKKLLPAEKDFRESGIVKDIAAFANAGGGMIVFGVTETTRAASGRYDAGLLTESYERTIRQISMAAISPPVFGVQAFAIPSTTENRAVALLVPGSPDGPHLVYRNDQFGAPLRTGADTHWMKERQIESAYRYRFEGQRLGEESLRQIYDDMANAADTSDRAVLVGAARPRTRHPQAERREWVTGIVTRATLVTRWWLAGTNDGPLEHLDMHLERPTLNGRYLPPTDPGDCREAHAVILNDSSVGLSWRAGGHERDKTGRHYEPHQIPTRAVEAFAASLLALVHAVAADGPADEYDIVLGVEFESLTSLRPEFHVRNAAPPSGVHRTLSGRFRPVQITADSSVDEATFISAAIDIATSALNQVGLKKPSYLDTMLTPRPRDWTW
ncbi:AlbA family DNA-binding domain-containing protein [Plantibacter flavus]|uniref:AlbA family DNA-binding domain-containing protein n=1 Tax=Plantibacter flavus TaxID=150123 RepID=UPI001375DB3B|nr:ATP-binding protein [Plantibacter flavus]